MTVTPEYPIKRRCDVTEGEEYRDGPTYPWVSYVGSTSSEWVEVRPKRQPDPAGAFYPHVESGKFTCDITVTTVGEMRDRTDLDQWEVANWDHGEWGIYEDPLYWKDPADFPVIVRRKQP